ncbi:MAG: hypothetical protein ACLGIG_02615 [Actinomycetes bacterium]
MSSYGRHAAVRAKVDVLIANSGSEPVNVTTWQIRHPLFEPIPPVERESVLPADGATRIVPVPFGKPLCDRTDGDADGAVVVLQVVGPDGAERETVVPLEDREPGLVRAHRLACAAERVTAIAALDLAPPYERDTADGRPRLRTRLALDRRGPGTLTVVGGSLTGNILFTVSGMTRDLMLGDEEASASTPVDVAATRCEAHALIESKTSFTFPLFAAVDGGEPTHVQMTVSPGAREALQSLLDDTCGPDV